MSEETQAAQNNTEGADSQNTSGQQTGQTNDAVVDDKLPPVDFTGKQATIDDAKNHADSFIGAPEKYGDFNVPDGVVVRPDMLEKTETIARELNLSQAGAQKLIDLAPELSQAMADAQQEHWDTVVSNWESSIKEDPNFGGPKFDETMERAKRVLNEHGNDALKTFLEETRFGSNPDLIKLLAKIDQKMGEDKLVDGKPSGVQEKSAAEILYPSQEPKQ